ATSSQIPNATESETRVGLAHIGPPGKTVRYTPAFKRQMIDLVRGGLSAADASDDWRVGVACAVVSESRAPIPLPPRKNPMIVARLAPPATTALWLFVSSTAYPSGFTIE